MENTALENTVLSPEDVACFKQHGYVYLPKAFSRADALAIQDSGSPGLAGVAPTFSAMLAATD